MIDEYEVTSQRKIDVDEILRILWRRFGSLGREDGWSGEGHTGQSLRSDVKDEARGHSKRRPESRACARHLRGDNKVNMDEAHDDGYL